MGTFRTFLRWLFGKSSLSRGAEESGRLQSPSFNEDWSQADHIIVQTTHPGDPSHWRVELTTAGDRGRIDIQWRNDKGTGEGTIVVVEKGMATNNLPVVSGREIDTLDIPYLQTQLVIALLLRAFPSGPAAIGQEVRVVNEAGRAPIEVTVGHAFTIYGPPWSLRGTVRRKQAEVIEYALAFTAIPGPSPGLALPRVYELAGIVEKLAAPFELPDSFPLQDWRCFRLGPSLGEGRLDYVAAPVETRFCTVGQLRQATQPLAREEWQKIIKAQIARGKES
jgi:hypothetical protein